jgi:SAM-dependent methyltransferase
MIQQTANGNSQMFARCIGRTLAALPVVGAVLRSPARFRTSSSYWAKRYEHGNNSGAGSYGRLALFKADIINRFVRDNGVIELVEFGSGDGAQLGLADYPRYVGIDVSPRAVALCRQKFSQDSTKAFFGLESGVADTIRADMAMSLDVIYHLVEDEVYEVYMQRLVRSAGRFICVYSSNVGLPGHVAHVRHRCFSDWFAENAPEWSVTKYVRNAFPYDIQNPDQTSWADFYFFSRGAISSDRVAR